MSTAPVGTTIPQVSSAGIWIHDPANTDPEAYRSLSSMVLPRLPTTAVSLQPGCAGRLGTESGRTPIHVVCDLLYLGQPHLMLALTGGLLVDYNLGKEGSTQTILGFPSAKPRFGKFCLQYFDPQFRLVAPPSTTSPFDSCGLTFTAVIPAETCQAVQADSATTPVRDEEAEAKFRSLFQRGSEQDFEDGMESEFSLELESLVKAYGPNSKPILTRLLEDASVSPYVWAEGLRCLGRLADAASHETRLWVLEKGLTSAIPIVRDGAALGLASMDDPSAIPYLQQAINSERIGELRKDMEQVLSQLVSQE